jgi:hypothetical protein
MFNEPDFKLEQLDPLAKCCVITDVKACESGFSSGEGIRQNWESGLIQRVHQLDTPASANPDCPWYRCLCPDGSTIFIKFLSSSNRLIDELTSKPTSSINTMADKETATKKTPPPRKKAAEVKPVKAPKSKTTTKPVKAPKPKGNYKWLQFRFNAQATDALSTGDNRGAIREGLKSADSFTGAVAFLERANAVGPSTIDPKLAAFLDEFFSAAINRPTK